MIDRRLSYIQALEAALRQGIPEWSEHLPPIEQPPALEGAPAHDLAIPCFSLAKTRRVAPPVCAEQVKGLLESKKKDLSIESLEVNKGYVNLSFDGLVMGRALVARLEDPLADAKTSLAKEKVIVEYSSPNIAKPFGIGHLRSTNIGAAISRLYQALGAKVIRINHLGDWGTQFGKIITAYKRFGSAEFVRGDPVNNLYKLYVEFHEKEKDDPALIDEARDWFVKLEEGDAEAEELWKWFKDVSYHEFKRLYDRLRVEFDYVTGESFYNKLMVKTVERLKKDNLLKSSDGAEIVDLEPFKMPPCLITKSDGSSLYATRDLAAAEYRAKTFQPTRMIYVVGGEQTLHFRQVFKILELMGYDWAKNCTHVPFGLIKFPEGKMSTRKGNIILLENVLDEAEREALKIVQEKNAEKPESRRLSEDEQISVAKKVGPGAVIFFDLHAKRTKDILFDWKTILNFEGDSGPYLQYTAVRLKSLLERAAEEGFRPSLHAVPQLSAPEEKALARYLLRFPAVVESAAREAEPSLLSHELLDLAAAFNRFYMSVPVLKGDEGQRASRLGLVKCTLSTLQCGLGLLGIECPDRM